MKYYFHSISESGPSNTGKYFCNSSWSENLSGLKLGIRNERVGIKTHLN